MSCNAVAVDILYSVFGSLSSLFMANVQRFRSVPQSRVVNVGLCLGFQAYHTCPF